MGLSIKPGSLDDIIVVVQQVSMFGFMDRQC